MRNQCSMRLRGYCIKNSVWASACGLTRDSNPNHGSTNQFVHITPHPALARPSDCTTGARRVKMLGRVLVLRSRSSQRVRIPGTAVVHQLSPIFNIPRSPRMRLRFFCLLDCSQVHSYRSILAFCTLRLRLLEGSLTVKHVFARPATRSIKP